VRYLATLQQPIRIRLQHNILAIGEAVQYDTFREFHFIFDDYEIPLETTDIRIYLEKPSGKAIYNYGTLINGEVVFQPTSQTLGEYGTCIGEVQIINNAAILTTFPFKLEVQKNLVDDTNFVSKDEFLILDELIKTAREQSKEISALNKRVTNNEDSRVSAENERKSNETQRQSKENERRDSELSRISAENSRISAENNRVSAENKRQNDSANAIKNCNAAKKEVDDIMSILNTELKSAINDEITSSITTYSSTKIVNMFENQVIASKYEPENQSNGGLWLLEE
jgi:hypothetical protein